MLPQQSLRKYQVPTDCKNRRVVVVRLPFFVNYCVFIVLFVMEGTVLIVVDLTVLIAGVGMANPSLSTWGVSVFVSTPSDFDS